MKDDGGSAFPREDYQTERAPGQSGMTLRQWNKGQAPVQAHSWFKHKSRPRPEVPEVSIDVHTRPEEASLRATIQDLVDNWRNDPCYDLDGVEGNWTQAERGAMCLYETMWHEYWKAEIAWGKQDSEDRYFQWRGYYADAMIAEDEEFAKKAEGE